MSPCVTSIALVISLFFLSESSGSAISFQSSASSFKPLISDNLTITCSLHDTSPAGAVVGRSLTSLPEGDALADDLGTGEEETQTDKITENLDDFADPDDLADRADPDDLADSDDLADPDGRTVSQRSLTQTTDNMAFVTSIIISRDGKDIATVTEHFPARQVGGASGFQVFGKVPGTSGEKGHLQLVWAHPTQGDGGNYLCDISSLDSQGRNHVFDQTLDISEDDVSINDLVGHLQKTRLEKEAMQETVVDLKHTVGDQANTIGIMNQSINTLTMDKEAMQQTIVDQANTIGIVNQSLNTLTSIARVEPNIFFSAAVKSSVWVLQDQAVIFDRVITNQGASYNSSTGAFTCPLSGFYHFEMHAYSDHDDAWLVLRQNGNDIISVRCSGDDDYRGSSNSVTVHLAKGDTVNVVSYGSKRSYIYGSNSDMSYTTLTGRLIALA